RHTRCYRDWSSDVCSSDLDAMLRNPQLDPRAKAQALEDVLGGADKLVRNFLLLTVEKNRAGQLRGIHREFERLMAAEERRLTVEDRKSTRLNSSHGSISYA